MIRIPGIARSVAGWFRSRHVRPANQRGVALLTVLVFAFVFLLGFMAFFAVTGYEAGQTQIRQDSMRAFYLADGAIEKAKCELLKNGRWATGYARTPVDGGLGSYRLSVGDTLYQGGTHKKFYAEGFYRRTKRDVEVIADIVPPGYEFAILSLGNITTRGNICLSGGAHWNQCGGDGSHFTCTGSYDNCFGIFPPVIYTEPDSFPGATYYNVTCAAGNGGNPDTLWVMDRHWQPIAGKMWLKPNTPPFPVSPPSVNWNYFPATKMLDFRIQPTDVFDQTTGLFPRAAGDSFVVVNFGGRPATDHLQTSLDFHETGTFEIPTTIINTRYIGGLNPADRLDKNSWFGGPTTASVKSIWAPTMCISLICQSISGNAQANLGTAAHPALTYVMNNVDFSTGQWSITGTLICLGDMSFGGGVNLTYNRSFISCLPPPLRLNWPTATSGNMEVLLWREPPPRPS